MDSIQTKRQQMNQQEQKDQLNQNQIKKQGLLNTQENAAKNLQNQQAQSKAIRNDQCSTQKPKQPNQQSADINNKKDLLTVLKTQQKHNQKHQLINQDLVENKNNFHDSQKYKQLILFSLVTSFPLYQLQSQSLRKSQKSINVGKQSVENNEQVIQGNVCGGQCQDDVLRLNQSPVQLSRQHVTEGNNNNNEEIEEPHRNLWQNADVQHQNGQSQKEQTQRTQQNQQDLPKDQKQCQKSASQLQNKKSPQQFMALIVDEGLLTNQKKQHQLQQPKLISNQEKSLQKQNQQFQVQGIQKLRSGGQCLNDIQPCQDLYILNFIEGITQLQHQSAIKQLEGRIKSLENQYAQLLRSKKGSISPSIQTEPYNTTSQIVQQVKKAQINANQIKIIQVSPKQKHTINSRTYQYNLISHEVNKDQTNLLDRVFQQQINKEIQQRQLQLQKIQKPQNQIQTLDVRIEQKQSQKRTNQQQKQQQIVDLPQNDELNGNQLSSGDFQNHLDTENNLNLHINMRIQQNLTQSQNLPVEIDSLIQQTTILNLPAILTTSQSNLSIIKQSSQTLSYATISSIMDSQNITSKISFKQKHYPSLHSTQKQLKLYGKRIFRTLFYEQNNLNYNRCSFNHSQLINDVEYDKSQQYIVYYIRYIKNFVFVCYYNHTVYIGEYLTQGPTQQITRQGYGIQIRQNKYVYQGQFFTDKKHGFGFIKFIGRVPSIYFGYFLDGFMDVNGKQMNEKGEVYVGQYKIGQKDGFGKLTYNIQKDTYYQGQFYDGHKHGKGYQGFQNGDSYTGLYCKNKFQGYGQYKWKNGTIYKGTFVDGYKHGKGFLHFINGKIFQKYYDHNKQISLQNNDDQKTIKSSRISTFSQSKSQERTFIQEKSRNFNFNRQTSTSIGSKSKQKGLKTSKSRNKMSDLLRQKQIQQDLMNLENILKDETEQTQKNKIFSVKKIDIKEKIIGKMYNTIQRPNLKIGQSGQLDLFKLSKMGQQRKSMIKFSEEDQLQQFKQSIAYRRIHPSTKLSDF